MNSYVAVGGLLIAMSLGVGSTFLLWESPPQITDLPETIHVPSGSYDYRPSGDFRIGTTVVDAPLERRHADAAMEIMKYPVSVFDYQLCVSDDVCTQTTSLNQGNSPQIDISYYDATTYAQWFSEMTGETWRLPTDDEWVRAAADRYVDAGLGTSVTDTDPSKRWLLNYRRRVSDRGAADLEVHEFGYFGKNALGVADIAGNVWEWTESCFLNGQVSDDGTKIVSQTTYCGVRAVQGKHRAFIIDFVRDAKAGGCAVGLPPDYLGFRLVRDRIS